jgi:benzoate 4-monooxygenase
LVCAIDIALTQLIAGSDTTSNSSCAILFYIVSNPRVHKKLVAELEEAIGAKGLSGVLEYEDVKEMRYLQACINEALRMHSTSGMGLRKSGQTVTTVTHRVDAVRHFFSSFDDPRHGSLR